MPSFGARGPPACPIRSLHFQHHYYHYFLLFLLKKDHYHYYCGKKNTMSINSKKKNLILFAVKKEFLNLKKSKKKKREGKQHDKEPRVLSPAAGHTNANEEVVDRRRRLHPGGKRLSEEPGWPWEGGAVHGGAGAHVAMLAKTQTRQLTN